MKLWCFEDAHDWGSRLAQAAQARGHDAHLFDDPQVPDNGYVFVHMHHHPAVRTFHKRMMELMSVNPDLIMIPDYRSARLYDDKMAQARELKRWMPRTRLFYTPNSARFALPNIPLPFVSKTAEGASAHNVRLVSTYDEARLEIKRAFSDLGIKCHYEQAQHGYLLWQDFIPGNAGDVRIIAIGSKRLLLRRGNRRDRAMASGSGNLKPIQNLNDTGLLAALDAANEFFAAEGFKWCGVDLVHDASGKWFILEMTSSWTLHGYYECNFIDCSGSTPKLMDERGDQVWPILLQELEAGVFE
jgi:glutathione synthase/RimK-type ligase-like ATP-grasp enzyme